jgi:anthranilate synthase/aminodeoxychorismate synthase-like glutamine amidotransferase
MILVIDNYDSFTYNLVQYLGELGEVMEVFRNDEITVQEAQKLNPTHVVISPGPCTPSKAGVSKEIIKHFTDKIPILGVCLGHQAIGEVFGGKVIRAPFPVHGKVSRIHHDGKSIFKNLKNPFGATRYHSLIVEKESLPKCLNVSALTEDGLIMGLRHAEFQVEGVQFHPESILTGEGKKLLKNFISVKSKNTERQVEKRGGGDVAV